MQNKTLKIALSGGGTAGHLFPIVSVVRKIKEQTTKPAEFYFIGPKTIGEEFLTQEGIKRKKIFAGKLRRYLSPTNIIDLVFKLPLGILQCLWILFWLMPDVIFCKGGFGSLPAALVAWLYRIPIIVHESDAAPGLANRVIGKLAKRIAISFSEAKSQFPAEKTALIGNPLREEIFGGTKQQAITTFNLKADKPLLLIIGGSQGADAINTIVMASLPKLLEKVEIIHQCGERHLESIKMQLPQTIPPDSTLNYSYHYYGFLDQQQMKQAYAIADLILSRAGANTISEIAALGKPSILIPLPESAANHQAKNAFAFAQSGATIVLDQPNLTPNMLIDKIYALIADKELLEKMSKGALNFAYPQASQNLAEATLGLANI